MPITISDVPRLNINKGKSKMELTTSSCATPAVCFFSPSFKKEFILITEQSTCLGNSGIIVEENNERNKSSISITAPAVREYKYEMTKLLPSNDKSHDWKAEDDVILNFKIIVKEANSIQDLFDDFFINRKTLSGINKYRNLTPYSKAWEMQEKWQNDPDPDYRWFEKGGYYKSGNGQVPFSHIQVGWVGALIHEYPLFMRGTELSKKRSLSTINVVFNNLTGKSGFFYGIYKDGKVCGDNFNDMEKIPQVAMTRKNADALYYLVKILMLLEERNKDDKNLIEWRPKVKRLADAFVNLWNKYKQFGQLIDVETGEIVVGGSTAGAMTPAALATASKYFNNSEYLKIAEASAEMYYNRDVKMGYTTGGPGEILQCPHSESAFAMLESFVVLFEISKNKKWLAMAEDMVKICATWVVSYDFKFPFYSIDFIIISHYIKFRKDHVYHKDEIRNGLFH